MEQSMNDTRIILKVSRIVSRRDTYPIGQKQGNYTSMLTSFKNQMEELEFHSCHLIYVQTFIDSFLLKQTITSVRELNTEAKPSSVLFHETVAVGLASCLLQEGHNRGPGTDNVSNERNHRRH